jgi:hypothetical protein
MNLKKHILLAVLAPLALLAVGCGNSDNSNNNGQSISSSGSSPAAVSGLTLGGSTSQVSPYGTAQFTASGGNPPYTYSIYSNGSGGSINSTSGQYQAGANNNVTDYIQVNDSAGATAQASIYVSNGVGPGPSGSPGPSGGGTSSCSNSGNAARGYYQFYGTGTGTGSYYSNYNQIIADQKLRVSFQPGPAQSTSGGTKNYSYMAADVSLMQNGYAIATVTVPVQNNGSTGYSSGQAVGYKTDPSLVDFSSYLQGNTGYYIKISNVRTDYKCNTYCTTSYYGCYYSYDYYQSCAYTWNWDYHTNNWYCCYDDMVTQCQRQQCGVGTLNGLTDAGWSVTVYVETDSTTCIPYP